MQRSLFAIVLAATSAAGTLPVLAAEVGVSVSIGQPGFYGRIDVGGYPQPPLAYPQPIFVERVPIGRPPVYLHVPPGHAKHWSKHCGKYGACGQPVYFVREDVVSTWAGVRPVVASGKGISPSKERRDHVVWDDRGLITVTGGKLTTFRSIALDALAKAAPHVPGLDARDDRAPTFRRVERLPASTLPQPVLDRLVGRYGPLAARFVAEMPASELVPIGGTDTLVADLRWAARHEAVVRLEDLLLRRTRLGIVLPDGGSAQVELIKRTVQAELGLSDEAYAEAWSTYLQLVRSSYGLPG